MKIKIRFTPEDLKKLSFQNHIEDRINRVELGMNSHLVKLILSEHYDIDLSVLEKYQVSYIKKLDLMLIHPDYPA